MSDKTKWYLRQVESQRQSARDSEAARRQDEARWKCSHEDCHRLGTIAISKGKVDTLYCAQHVPDPFEDAPVSDQRARSLDRPEKPEGPVSFTQRGKDGKVRTVTRPDIRGIKESGFSDFVKPGAQSGIGWAVRRRPGRE